MNADPELRDRLERAAAFVSPDVARRLERVRRGADRRSRGRRIRALAVAATVGLLAVVVVARLPFGRSPERPGAGEPAGTIVFLGDRGDHRGLFALDLASGDVAPLTPAGDRVLAGAVSPDGERIASIVERPGPRYGIVVTAADGTEPVTIVDAAGTGAVGPDLIDVAWSPDGSRIAYSGRVVEDGVSRRTILIVDADGGGEPHALDGLWVSVDWSAEGRLLLLGSPEREGYFDLYSARPDGTGLAQLTHDEVTEHEPSWSPDGETIVFAMGGASFQDVYVMDAVGSNVHRLTSWEGLDVFPAWSPDGRWIAFASDRDASSAQQEANRSGEVLFGGLSLYVMRPDGSEVAMILEADAALPLGWAP